MFIYKPQLFMELMIVSVLLSGLAALMGSTADTTAGSVFYVLLVLLMSVVAHVTWDIWQLNPAESHSTKSLFTQYVFIVMVRILGGKYLGNILKATEDVKKQQEENLVAILDKNKATKYGMKYKFDVIKSRDEFRQIHPLTSYADYQEEIRDIQNGVQNVLTSDKVIFLATSSGTTGKNKTLPITAEKASMGKTIAMAMYHIIDKKCGLNLRRYAMLRYKPTIKRTPCGLTVAPITYLLTKYFPFYISPRCVSDINDERAALYAHALFWLAEPEIVYIDGLMATLMYSFWVQIEQRWPELCDDIEIGRMRPLEGITDGLLKEINDNLKPNPERAGQLRKEFENGFQGIARKVWKSLESVRMLSTGGFAHYARLLREGYMEGVHQLSVVHGASEGFLGINISGKPEMTSLMAMPLFYVLEFIPESACGEEQPETLFLEQLEVGQCYEMVITSEMGLYRYRLGDVIKVMDHVGRCPVYEFQYRSGQILNLFWEKTDEEAFYTALMKAAEKLSIEIIEYTTTESSYLDDLAGTPDSAIDTSLKCYVLFLEAQKGGDVWEMSDYDVKVFDQCLCEVAELYRSLRRQSSIGRMRVLQVRRGTFQNVRNKLVSKQSNQQVKMPRVIHNPEILELLLSSLQ